MWGLVLTRVFCTFSWRRVHFMDTMVSVHKNMRWWNSHTNQIVHEPYCYQWWTHLSSTRSRWRYRNWRLQHSDLSKWVFIVWSLEFYFQLLRNFWKNLNLSIKYRIKYEKRFRLYFRFVIVHWILLTHYWSCNSIRLENLHEILWNAENTLFWIWPPFLRL